MTSTNEPPTRRSRRVFVVAGVCGIAGMMLPATAGAIPHSADAEATKASHASVALDAAPADDRPVDRRPEVLRLECNVRQIDNPADRATGVRSAVVCHWSTPTSDGAAAVRLLRVAIGSGQGRTTIFRTSNLEVTEHIDSEVRQGHRYAYAAQALDARGRIVGQSRAVTVAVPLVDRPGVEVLDLRCAVADTAPSADERVRIGCGWSLPHADGARVLTLWRSVDGGTRERVVSFTQPFETSYRDAVSARANRVSYSVIVTDGSGVTVARSRTVTVGIPDAPTRRSEVDVRPTDVRPTDTAPTEPAPTDVAPTDVPPADVPPTNAPPADVPPTDVPPVTDVPVRDAPVRDVPVRDRPVDRPVDHAGDGGSTD